MRKATKIGFIAVFCAAVGLTIAVRVILSPPAADCVSAVTA